MRVRRFRWNEANMELARKAAEQAIIEASAKFDKLLREYYAKHGITIEE